MRQRVIIHSVAPEVEHGRYPLKRVPGQRVRVTCAAFGDGHDHIRQRVIIHSVAPSFRSRWR